MKGKWKAIAALALACALMAAAPGTSGSARAAELVDDHKCSLTVYAGGSDIAEDVGKANVVVDLYKVAAVEPDVYETSDTVPAEGPFEGLVIQTTADRAGWDQLEQRAAEIALKSETPPEPDVLGAEAGTKLEGLDAGFYLVVARGSDLTNYVTSVKRDNGEKWIATSAQSEQYRYKFLPELVYVPGKDVVNEHLDLTAPWNYDVKVTLKPQQEPRLDGIKIVKTLTEYKGGPATFVFSVEARIEGRLVFSDVVSIVFTKAGTKSLDVEGIPVGAEVTVTEVYSGASYKCTSDPTQKAVFSAEENVTVEFTNGPVDVPRTGGSIKNAFTYTEGSGWEWTPIPDRP